MPREMGTCKRCSKSFSRDGRDALWFDLCWDYALDDHCSACFQSIGRLEKNWNGLVACVHWLAWTSRGSRSDTLDALSRCVYATVPESVAASFRDVGHGGNGYECCSVGPYAVRVYYSPGREDHHVVVPGQACDVMTTRAVLDLLAGEGRAFTRVDLALDGVQVGGRPLSPSFVYDLCREHPEQVRTRVRLGGAA